MTTHDPSGEPSEQPYEIDDGHVLEPVATGGGDSLLDRLLGEPPAPVARDVNGRLWRVRSTGHPRPEGLLLVALGLGAVLLVVILMVLAGV